MIIQSPVIVLILISETQQWVNFYLFLIGFGVLVALALDAKKRALWLRLVIGLLVSGAFFAGMYFSYPYTEHLRRGADEWLTTMAGRFAIAVAVLAFGMFAHWFKSKDKLRYGQVEVVFGALSVISVANGISPKDVLFSKWVALAGSAYVVARGLNNWSDALAARKDEFGFDSVANHIGSWIGLMFVKDDESSRAKSAKAG